MNLSQIGGRRFLLTCACWASTTALTWYGKVDAGVYATVIIAVLGTYVAGNTVQKLKAPHGGESL